MASSTNNIVCPNCETFLRPPFTTCSGGHLLCKNCRQHIDAVTGEAVAFAKCGEHKYPMELLNKLFRDITDECQYGCGHRTNVVDLAKHEEACPMKSKCAVKACNWLGQITKLVKHVEDNHPGKLVDASAVQHNFTLGFKHPVLMLTQWEETGPNNASYWLRLHKNGKNQFIMMQYAGQTSREVDKKFLLKEYSVSPVNYPKITVNIEVVFNKSDEDDILNDNFVESQGTDVTIFNSDEFLIKIKDVPPLISESLALNLECFMCAEIMSAPIRMCVTGHSFCDTCCGKINNKCPNCQKEINPLARNYALEAVTDSLLPNVGNSSRINEIAGIPCKYRDSGCQFTDEDDIDGHVEVCEFQPWKCAYSTENNLRKCKWKGPHKYLVEHIVAEHGKSIGPVNAPHLASSRRGCYYYHYDSNYFVCTLCATSNNDYVISFRHLTTKAESNYNYKLSAVTTNGIVLRILAGSFKPYGQRSRDRFCSQHLKCLNDDQLTIVVNISRKPV